MVKAEFYGTDKLYPNKIYRYVMKTNSGRQDLKKKDLNFRISLVVLE